MTTDSNNDTEAVTVEKAASDKYPVRSDTENLAKAILEVMELADSHGVASWLCYGALLGMVREKRLLPWNNDAELGCWYEPEIKKKFRQMADELNSRGYHAYFYSTVGALGVRKKGVNVNLNCFWREGEYAVRPHETASEPGYSSLPSHLAYWVGVSLGAYPSGIAGASRKFLSNRELAKSATISLLRILPLPIRLRLVPVFYGLSRTFGGKFQKTGIPAEYFEEFSLFDFYGGKVRIPANPDRLLQFIYGEGWRVPKDAWSFYAEGNKRESGIVFIDEMWDYGRMDIL